MNATRRPIDPAVLAAVAAGAMPLAVFADWLEENDWPARLADALRNSPQLAWYGGGLGSGPEIEPIRQAVMATLIRQFAASFGVPAKFVGDVSNANYSSRLQHPS